MANYPVIIPDAGACLASKNVLSRAGRVRWMLRYESKNRVDNGWRIFSHIDSSEYLANPNNLEVVDFNEVCAIEPALIGIWDFPVGSDLQIVDDGQRIRVVDTPTGEEIPEDSFYIPPPQPRRGS